MDVFPNLIFYAGIIGDEIVILYLSEIFKEVFYASIIGLLGTDLFKYHICQKSLQFLFGSDFFWVYGEVG